MWKEPSDTKRIKVKYGWATLTQWLTRKWRRGQWPTSGTNWYMRHESTRPGSRIRAAVFGRRFLYGCCKKFLFIKDWLLKRWHHGTNLHNVIVQKTDRHLDPLPVYSSTWMISMKFSLVIMTCKYSIEECNLSIHTFNADFIFIADCSNIFRPHQRSHLQDGYQKYKKEVVYIKSADEISTFYKVR
jgi:hypothetical protein